MEWSSGGMGGRRAARPIALPLHRCIAAPAFAPARPPDSGERGPALVNARRDSTELVEVRRRGSTDTDRAVDWRRPPITPPHDYSITRPLPQPCQPSRRLPD